MTHVDGHILRLLHFPDFGRRQSGRSCAHLSSGGNTKRGRQLRLIPGQRQRVERGASPPAEVQMSQRISRGLLLGLCISASLFPGVRSIGFNRHCERSEAIPFVLMTRDGCFAEPVIRRAFARPLARNDGWA
jgi:hypothetical protein